MTRPRRATAVACGVAFAITAVSSCGGRAPSVPVGAQLGPALSAALTRADRLRAPWRCLASDGPELTKEAVTVGAHAWRFGGHLAQRDDADELVIGAIADAGGAAPDTVAALGRLRAKLARADLVLALGGMGTTEAELEATLGAIASKDGYPVIALPGDLESAGALAAAVHALRARGLVAVDGRLVHRIELGTAQLAVVAGAGAPGRLVAGAEGCSYLGAASPGAGGETTLAHVVGELSTWPRLRILVSAEAPRITVEGEPAGELALTPGPGTEIDLVLHGPTSEAASRAREGGRDGDAVTLTPGTADATTRLPGPAHRPSAGLLTLRGTSWSWRPITDSD